MNRTSRKMIADEKMMAEVKNEVDILLLFRNTTLRLQYQYKRITLTRAPYHDTIPKK